MGGALVAVVVGAFAIDAVGGTDEPAAKQTPPTAVAGAAAPPATEPVPATTVLQVDLEGCTLDVLSVKAGDTGEAVVCVQKALIVAGHYQGPVDGQFNDGVRFAAESFQRAKGLYVDGIVGRRTSEELGIWPGDESFIVRTPKPKKGAMDSTGYLLSSVASTGSKAPEPPPDTGQGTGYRIVYSRAGQRVWAIDDNERIVRSYLVSGSQYNNEVPGRFTVYSKSEEATGWNFQAKLPYMVRYYDTARGAIGFHQIPIKVADGSVYQTEEQLGTRLSGGCQRQAPLDAMFMWEFAKIGTPVYVH